MEGEQSQQEAADRILEAMRRAYGFVPVVNQVLSVRPDIFIPVVTSNRAILEGEGDMEQKTRYLCAVSAATAAGGEHCVDVQIKHAVAGGATKDEVLEAIMIGSMMAGTRAQSYALRRYAENFGINLEPTDGDGRARRVSGARPGA